MDDEVRSRVDRLDAAIAAVREMREAALDHNAERLREAAVPAAERCQALVQYMFVERHRVNLITTYGSFSINESFSASNWEELVSFLGTLLGDLAEVKHQITP